VENSSKSTLIRTIAGLVSEYKSTCQLRSKFLNDRFEIGRFPGQDPAYWRRVNSTDRSAQVCHWLWRRFTELAVQLPVMQGAQVRYL
jgi:hypothetical protein